MKQLSGLDNASLIGEKGNVFNHVGALLVYDTTTADEGNVRYKDILRHFEERLHTHPLFSDRLAQVPLGIDRPYWVTTSEIDTEYHIRHIALPKPGDWRQLMIQVARLHSRPLDLSRPLWEVYIIEGLDNVPKLPKGSFAMFIKMHHAAVDGMAVAKFIENLHTTTPVKPPEDATRQPIVAESDPGLPKLLVNTIGHNLGRAGKLARISGKSTLRLLTSAKKQLQEFDGDSFSKLSEGMREAFGAKAPVTRFGERVSAHRVLEGYGLPISRIKRVRAKVPGSTLNDIFIAVAAGAARKYLDSKGELPEASLTALMPIALRSDGSGGGNQVGIATVKVCSDIADPIDRLKAVRAETVSGKAAAERAGLDMTMNILDVVPPRLAKAMNDHIVVPTLNIAVSNVRGPNQDMYLAGAKAMCMYPVSIPGDGVGLNFTGVSYNGIMWISMVSCRAMVPDPNFMLTCMQDAWNELLDAADALPLVK